LDFELKHLIHISKTLTSLNLFLIVITGIILVTFFTSTEILAQNSVTSQYGGLNTDQAVYSLERHEIAYVKISGVGPDTNVRERVSIIITLPDSTKSNHSVFSTKDGDFELILPIPYESLGNYKVFASMTGKILGDIYFAVVNFTGLLVLVFLVFAKKLTFFLAIN